MFLLRVFFVACIAVAAQGQTCPPDQDWNGHPLFRGLTSSPVVETFDNLIEAESLRFADLNGDGLQDAICAMSIRDSYVAIMLSRGDGLYERRMAVTAGDEDELETADAYPVDLDGDGDLDLATANARADDATMLFNDGQANFTRGERYPLGNEPRSIIAGDLDGDGDQDLAFMNVISQDVSILLNRGDGTFEKEIRVAVGGTTPRGQPNRNFPYPGPFLAVGDLDGDQDLDLVVPGGTAADILINDGAAGFTLSDPARVGDTRLVYDIEVRDLDGDDDLDIAAALFGTHSFMGIWLNDGAGSFGTATLYDATVNKGFHHFSTSVALGDLDNDGDLDAIMGNEFHGKHTIHRNNGDGTFAPFEDELIAEGPWLAEILDVNGDGWEDLVAITSEFSVAHLITHLNDGKGTPRGSLDVELDVHQHFEYSASDAADLDGDGDLDLVLAVQSNSPLHIRVMENDGAGRFSERFRMFVGEENLADVEDVKLVDLNGDKSLDLVMSLRDNPGDGLVPGAILVSLREDVFGFAPVERTELIDLIPYELAIADLDNDGDPDALLHCNEVFDPDDFTLPRDVRTVVLTNDGFGGLTISQQIVLDSSDRNQANGSVAAADLDGDGDIDAIVSSTRRNSMGLIHVLLNDGTGSLEISGVVDVSFDSTSRGITVRAGDFDGDGDADAAAMRWRVEGESPYLHLLENDGNGTFSVTQEFIAPEISMTNDMHLRDMDADGFLDIICVTENSGPVIHLNDGKGDFSNWAWYAASAPTSSFNIGDFDLDGDTDILSPWRDGHGFGEIVLLENVACRCAADLDRDGSLSADDFFEFLDRYSQGHLPFCDVDRDGDCDAEDFFSFLDLFAAGC